MHKKLGISVLIFSFGLSNVNIAGAAEIVNVPPIVVAPYDMQALNQQVLDRDRQNRDEEIAIKKLIEANNELTQTELARQNDEGLAKVNQTMLSYRDALFSRDRARIMANGEKWGTSRYGDLVALTEDTDAMTVHHDLEIKSGFLAEKYQMLTDLKDEMTALNEKLAGRGQDALNQKEATIDGFKKIAQEQQDKIQMLVNRLDGMDQQIAHLDDLLAQKDQQIASLKQNLSFAQNETVTQDETIRSQKVQIDILQRLAKTNPSFNNIALPPIIVNGSNNQQPATVGTNPSVLAAKDEIIKQQENQLAILKTQMQNMASQTVPVSPVIVQPVSANAKNNAVQEVAIPSIIIQDNGLEAQLTAIKNKMQLQARDLKAKDDSIRWLNMILAAVKNKGEYYKLTAQKERLFVQEVQKELQDIKDNFAKNSQNNDQLENTVVSLKNQVSQLGLQLSQKQAQVDSLTANIQTIQKNQTKDDRLKLAQQLIGLQEQEAALLDEKSELVMKQYDIFDQHFDTFEAKMKTLIAEHQIQIIDLKNRTEELQNKLDQKENQNNVLTAELKNKIAQERDQKVLVAQIQDLKAQLQDEESQVATLKANIQKAQESGAQVDALKEQLAQQQNKVDSLSKELESKNVESNKMTFIIADYQQKLESKNNAYNEQLHQILLSKNDQSQMENEIAKLSTQLQEKEAEVVNIKKNMYDLQELTSSKDRNAQTKDLNLSIMQQKVMDEKINEYRQKINDLQAANQAQVQELASLKSSLTQASQKVSNAPSSDEIEFLKTGLNKAALQLKQKDAMLLSMKSLADEYTKEFKEQTTEFQSLKDQLVDAQKDITRKDEDLKYKDMALVRLKNTSRDNENGLKTQVRALTQKLDDIEKKIKNKTYGNAAAALFNNELSKEKLEQALDKAKEQTQEIKDLKGQLAGIQKDTNRKDEDLRNKDVALTHIKDLSGYSENELKAKIHELTQKLEMAEKQLKNKAQVGNTVKVVMEDRDLEEKLSRALNKVAEQGQTISELTQRLRATEQQLKSKVHVDITAKSTSSNAAQQKLREALNKIEDQSQVINELIQKIQDAGKSVDLTKTDSDQ